MEQWAYQGMRTSDASLVEALNLMAPGLDNMGRAGWEMVNFAMTLQPGNPPIHHVVCFLKRRIDPS